MGIPDFIIRKLYKRGSLREVGDTRFAFTLRNTLAKATVIQPPLVVVNGINHPAPEVKSRGVDLAAISPTTPFVFQKGAQVTMRLKGRLLRGGNRIHITVTTQEYGELEIYVEDSEAIFCDVPGTEAEE